MFFSRASFFRNTLWLDIVLEQFRLNWIGFTKWPRDLMGGIDSSIQARRRLLLRGVLV